MDLQKHHIWFLSVITLDYQMLMYSNSVFMVNFINSTDCT